MGMYDTINGKQVKCFTYVLSNKGEHLYVDTSDIDDLIVLGEYLSACNCGNENDRKICKSTIRNLLATNDSLYDRYVEWQESDEYIKEFKSCCN